MSGWLVVDTCWTPPAARNLPKPHLAEDLPTTSGQRQWQRPAKAIRAAQKRAMRKIAARTPAPADSRGREHAAWRPRRAGVVIDHDAGASARIRQTQSRRWCHPAER